MVLQNCLFSHSTVYVSSVLETFIGEQQIGLDFDISFSYSSFDCVYHGSLLSRYIMNGCIFSQLEFIKNILCDMVAGCS